MTAGLYLSGLRCLLTYVLLPVAGTLGIFLGPVGLGLQILAAVTSTTGARRLWTLKHRLRVPYTVVAVIIDLATVAVFAQLVN